MKEAFRESREKTTIRRSRALEQQRKRAKQEKRKDFIAFLMFFIALILLIMLSMKIGQKSIEDCMNAGHSRTYCEKGA